MCLAPLIGWRSRQRNESGKRGIVFKIEDGYSDMPVEISCGQCFECRLQKAREWAMRCTHEASLHEDNCFVTLTYDNDHLPKNGSLVPDHLTKFMKDLRQWYRYRLNKKGIEVNNENAIRFFGCGEYGDSSYRPHYHVLLFGFDFLDKVWYTTRKGYRVYQSKVLDDLWEKGLSEVGSVTWQSAAYCARYVMKKFKSKDPEEVKRYYGELVPEFVRMSRRPGIGRGWFEKFQDSVYKYDSIITNGKEVKPPKYYDQLYEAVSPEALKEVKCRRKSRIDYEEQRGKRALVRSKILKSREKTFMKGSM